MIAWMIWGAVVTTLLAAGAACLEAALRLLGRPVRHAWVAASTGSVLLLVGSKLTAAPPAVAAAADERFERVVANLLRDLTESVGAAPAVVQRSDDVVLWVWVVASSLLITALGIGMWRLARRARSWPAVVVDGREVLVSESFGPALIGVLTPRIVVPRWALHLGSERLRMACLHEAEHQRGRDGALLLGSAVLAALAPWNPGLWWIHVRLRAAVELDCDARVLRAGARPVAYGAMLLELGTRALDVPPMVAAFARPRANLERRMTMIVRDRAPLGVRGVGRAAATTVAGLLLVVAACNAPAPTEAGPDVMEADVVAATPLRSVVETPSGTSWLHEDGPYADGEGKASGEAFHFREIGPLEGVHEAEPAAGSMIRLRSDEGGDGDPLIYVDGIRVDGPGVLDELSPDRIERVEVIKGPAAVGLYGDEAAAGVIKIFVKEGVAP